MLFNAKRMHLRSVSLILDQEFVEDDTEVLIADVAPGERSESIIAPEERWIGRLWMPRIMPICSTTCRTSKSREGTAT
jgi:hypothetical protein